MAKKELDPKDKFIHRDISWLSFNGRVLEEAIDVQNPLLERAKFLSIFVNNLDEFFMVRVAGLKRLLDSKANQRSVFGQYPQEVFVEIQKQTKELINKLYETYDCKIRIELEHNKIIFKKPEELTDDQRRFIKRYFDSTIFPIVTPLAVDEGHPFPILPSKTLALAVTLEKDNEDLLAIIPIPKVIPRILKVPTENDDQNFVLIEDIIKENLIHFFRGYHIKNCSLFRVIRDSEPAVSKEYSADLLQAIENEIRKRPTAKVVYLEAEESCPKDLLNVICEGLSFDQKEIFHINGPLDLTFLFQLMNEVYVPQLCYRGYSASKLEYEDIFEKMKEKDFLLHLPYESFNPTIDLIKTAANDQSVLAIKMTLYRVDEDSAIIAALKEAAKNKKQVTVLVEIKARFDEERNINWVKELEESGCHVVYGIAGMKIHSKITLVIRKEETRIRRYVHLSTGNYNEKTANIYTDIGYFSANDDFARDISDVFNVITGYSLPARWKRIVSSPYDLRKYFFELIDQEIEFQQKSKNGLIVAKINSLEDPQMIDKLYEASCAGVKIRLIVRGICCLIPGVRGLSENIEVKSIVGRFLEHSRLFMFNNNAQPRIFLSSADWMRRNLDRRIELLFEVYKADLKEHLQFLLEMHWKDNIKSRALSNSRKYVRTKASGEKFHVQDFLIDLYGKS